MRVWRRLLSKHRQRREERKKPQKIIFLSSVLWCKKCFIKALISKRNKSERGIWMLFCNFQTFRHSTAFSVAECEVMARRGAMMSRRGQVKLELRNLRRSCVWLNNLWPGQLDFPPRKASTFQPPSPHHQISFFGIFLDSTARSLRAVKSRARLFVGRK